MYCDDDHSNTLSLDRDNYGQTTYLSCSLDTTSIPHDNNNETLRTSARFVL